MKLILLLVAVVISLVNASNFGKHDVDQRRRSSHSLGIIDGKKVSIEKYPFMAAVFQDGTIAGSGVILNDHWILTTGFLVKWYSINELEFRVGSDNYGKGGQVLQVEEVITPSQYDGSWDYDIAVVKVNETIKFGKKVKAASLGTKKLKSGTKVTIVGWGSKTEGGAASSVLLASTLTVYSLTKCKTSYPYDDLTTRMMCTYNTNTGPYSDDFGDPLGYKDKVYGLYAGGDGDLTTPEIYACIPALHKWIKKAIKD